MPTIIVIDNIMDKEIGNGSIFRIFFLVHSKLFRHYYYYYLSIAKPSCRWNKRERERKCHEKKIYFPILKPIQRLL